VAFASLFAWLLLGERLTPLQMGGGVLILAGIAAVRAEGSQPVSSTELVTASTEPVESVIGQDLDSEDLDSEDPRAERSGSVTVPAQQR
jgi:hypothetical protein